MLIAIVDLQRGLSSVLLLGIRIHVGSSKRVRNDKQPNMLNVTNMDLKAERDALLRGEY